MNFNQIVENKENINYNYQKINYSKITKSPCNYMNLNEFSKVNESKTKYNQKMSRKINNSFEVLENINENSNYYQNIQNNDEDLDIELNSISKIIPINNFINIDQIKNNIKKENILVKAKPKIKRTPSFNSFFDDIQNDTQNQNNNITNYHAYNSNQCPEFNLTNFGLENRPKIQSNNKNEKEDLHSITNNNINNITNNNINNITNNNINNNISLFNNKTDFPIKRHNSVITPDINQFLNINNDTTFLNNTTHNNQYLYDEIQKIKKENRRLFLKNNELSLKIKTQEAKTKINSNYASINQKKLSSQKEEFLLQKIKKLESEIIKQKDLITKLTYNKRFNIGIRKIRVNSILIKGNNSKHKRKNSINNFNLNNLYCNKINKKKINSNTSNYNKTLPNNKYNKYVKKKSQNFKTNKEELSIHIRPSYSSISSSPKILTKENKNDLSTKNSKLNSTMIVYNKNNSVNLKLDNFEKPKNVKKNFNFKLNRLTVNKTEKNKIDERKSNEEFIFNKLNNKNVLNNDYNCKKLGPHKTYGKTSLIMSVINDNLLGNFNLSQYMNVHNNINRNLDKKLNLKRNSIF